MKKLVMILLGAILLLGACDQADRVSSNLSQEADNFNIVRRITVLNGVTNDTMFVMEGRMSIKADIQDNQLEIVVEKDKNNYQKHIIGLSDNTTYIVEDLDVKNVSNHKYEINFNPKMWQPFEITTKD